MKPRIPEVLVDSIQVLIDFRKPHWLPLVEEFLLPWLMVPRTCTCHYRQVMSCMTTSHLQSPSFLPSFFPSFSLSLFPSLPPSILSLLYSSPPFKIYFKKCKL